MLAEQRFEIILQELNEHRAAGVPRLCELTGASEATIRRDLNALARQGKLICDDDVVYLDAGTTTVRMVEHLKQSKATFVTNGVACALRLLELGLRGYVLGGSLKPGTGAVVGADALGALEGYNFTKAFLGINGITVRQGFTTPDPEEAAVKRKAAQRAYLTYILADSSKFETVSAASVLPLEKASIITDRLPDRAYLEHTIVKEVS